MKKIEPELKRHMVKQLSDIVGRCIFTSGALRAPGDHNNHVAHHVAELAEDMRSLANQLMPLIEHASVEEPQPAPAPKGWADVGTHTEPRDRNDRGTILTVSQLRLGDCVSYECHPPLVGDASRENRQESIRDPGPFMDMIVTAIDDEGVTLHRPYVTVELAHDANRTHGSPKWERCAEKVHFRFDSTMKFYLLA